MSIRKIAYVCLIVMSVLIGVELIMFIAFQAMWASKYYTDDVGSVLSISIIFGVIFMALQFGLFAQFFRNTR